MYHEIMLILFNFKSTHSPPQLLHLVAFNSWCAWLPAAHKASPAISLSSKRKQHPSTQFQHGATSRLAQRIRSSPYHRSKNMKITGIKINHDPNRSWTSTCQSLYFLSETNRKPLQMNETWGREVQEGDDVPRRLSPKFPAGCLLQGWLKMLLV